MITYVDTSVLIKLLIAETGSDRAGRIWESSDHLASVSLIVVEARAAIAAAEMRGRLTQVQHRRVKRALLGLVDQIDVVRVSDELIGVASDIAESEHLRGYDAVHLAAALLVGADVVATADGDLSAAALRQGLLVADPTRPG